MNISDAVERVPIHTDASGVIRVARTRVTLDTIVAAFEGGATAEEIALQYPSVPLVAVYSVITYYLRHKAEVGSYLTEREQLAARVRAEAEPRSPSAGIRQRLWQDAAAEPFDDGTIAPNYVSQGSAVCWLPALAAHR